MKLVKTQVSADSPSIHPEEFDDDTKSPWQEFHVPPVGDCKGRLAGRCDSGMKDAMETVLHSQVTPFKNESELLRYCVDIGLQIIAKAIKDPQLSDTIEKRRVIIRQLQDEEEGRQMLEFSERIRRNIDIMVSEGDIHSATEKVRSIRDTALSMKSPRWRKKTLALIERYKWMLKKKEGK